MKKILKFSELTQWRREQTKKQRTVVATNGCFDILHVGHLRYLKKARALGDVLLVGVNGDRSVRALKGKGRPINPARERAELLAALETVDHVVVFPEKKAVNFLKTVRPDIYTKGGDYSLKNLDQEEAAVIKKHGGKIKILPLVQGKATTALVKRIQKL